MNIIEFAQLNNIDSTVDVEIITQFLIKEYGYLFPQLKNIQSLLLSDLDIDKIIYNKDRVNQLQQENLEFYKSNEIPIIVYKSSQYTLIDGYHRMSLALLQQKTHIKSYIIS